MRKPLLLHTDDDSDEDGNDTKNPVTTPPKQPQYVPPINMSEVNDDEETKDLANTPRSQLSAE
jgi:hypothetical protein